MNLNLGRLIRFATPALLATLLAACASAGPPYQNRTVRQLPPPSPPVEAETADTQTAGAPRGRDFESAPAPVRVPERPAPVRSEPAPTHDYQPDAATRTLLASAQESARAGELSRAAAQIERALQIHPRDPHLWHELARVRLLAKEYALAASLAEKSNALAGDNAELRHRNQTIIDKARAASTG